VQRGRPWLGLDGFCDLEAPQHRQIFRIQRRWDAVLKQVRETAIAAEDRDQIGPSWPWILQVMDGVAWDADEVPAAGGDGGVTHVEDDRAAQHKEELRRLVMAVGRDPVAGVMHLQKLGAPARFRLAKQGEAAMVIAAQPVALELLGMQDEMKDNDL